MRKVNMTRPIRIMFHLLSLVLIIAFNAGHLFAKNDQVNNTKKTSSLLVGNLMVLTPFGQEEGLH